MRIGLLIYGDLATLSGGYLYNRQLVSCLREQGDQLDIFSLPPGNYWRLLGKGVSRVFLHKLTRAGLDVLIQDELVHPSLLRANRQWKQQVNFPIVALVHLLTAFDRHSFYGAWPRRAVERAYLGTVDGLILNSRTSAGQARELLGGHLPPHVIAVPAGNCFDEPPENVSGQASSEMAFPIEPGGLGAKSTVIPAKAGISMPIPPGPGDFGARREDARPAAPEDGPLKLLFVGNVIRRKGLHVLIQALARLARRPLPVLDLAGCFRLTVAGRLDMEPCYVKKMRRRVRSLGLQDVVTFAGPLQGADLVHAYSAHHLFVLPSAYEGYGMVYVEAQQFGLPVIGTRGGAAWEIIRPGENGWLIPPEDDAALAEILWELRRNPERLRSMSRRALAAFQAHPTWRDSARVIREFLLELTGKVAPRSLQVPANAGPAPPELDANAGRPAPESPADAGLTPPEPNADAAPSPGESVHGR